VKTQKGYYAIQGHRGRYQSKARIRLPIVTDNLSRTVAELSQLVQILDTAFLSHPLGGLGTMYDVHLWLIGKRIVIIIIINEFHRDASLKQNFSGLPISDN